MQRIAAPLVGGMLSVAVLTLVVIPAAYLLWKSRKLPRQARDRPRSPVAS
jgi:Cu(I)/Ag(I) efflux system membrane protein CusA/SilA